MDDTAGNESATSTATGTTATDTGTGGSASTTNGLAADLSPPAPGTIIGDGVALVDGVAPEVAEHGPPSIEADTGIALDGDYPVNHRLRAERLVAEGKTSDPGGVIDDELIADTATRMEGDKRAEAERLANEEAAFPPVRSNMKTADLETIATAHGIDISSAENNQARVDMIEAARAAGIATPANEGDR
ncbi:MAG: hypothetical protein H0W65_12060 [Sphingomonas sp.]|uniref:hypothetical protein n=1 Tax=Sphingomonas sp. TaxID=28214 RepID=UPI00182D5D48|nr:hypothetical protein [Sphingomonas sp.]MBA3668432.1 hypothetical protein [Sphingomonas sp.]